MGFFLEVYIYFISYSKIKFREAGMLHQLVSKIKTPCIWTCNILPAILSAKTAVTVQHQEKFHPALTFLFPKFRARTRQTKEVNTSAKVQRNKSTQIILVL